MRPLFIAFEGLDGSGQSTQAELLAKRLRADRETLLTKEPTNNLIGGLIRAQLTHEWSSTQECLQLLFAADRAHHLEREISPSLSKGRNVVTDRYKFSTIAFGSVNSDYEWLKQINSRFPDPDKVFFLDTPPGVCIERIKQSRFEIELFERLEYLEKVRENYLRLAKEFEGFVVIDGDRPVADVAESVFEAIKK